MLRALMAVLAASLALGSLAVQPVTASASGVVISEFRFRGPAGPSDEFVELRNAGAAPVDISGWKLQVCAAASGVAATRVTVPAETMLDVGERYLFSHTGYTGAAAPDSTYAIGIADEGGVRVADSAGVVVDGVGSSDGAVDECREGAGLALPTSNSDASLERTQDTDDNAADFTATTSTPQGCGVCTAATPTVSVGDVSVQEGNDGDTKVEVTVFLTRPVTVPVSVDVATRGESALAPDDYLSLRQTVLFAPGERARTVPVSVVGDLDDEPDETFALELSVPAGAVAADPAGRVTIIDDDEPASTPGCVFALGRADGRPRSLLVVAAKYRPGAAAPRGFVAFRDRTTKTRLFFTELTRLVVRGDETALVGTGFRLELRPGRQFQLSTAAGTVVGTAAIARRCGSFDDDEFERDD
jgi:uncharacterized protein